MKKKIVDLKKRQGLLHEPPKEGDLDVQKAQIALNKDRQERLAKCSNAVNEALQKFGCTITAEMSIRAGTHPVCRVIINAT